ncbi:hypothetical protein L2E82_12520 [Cichorium intybus]|uniref:Uncharacterized protein n=1 Tax=Cichorium intybus TaxID=13427 RepID=A0ACB9GH13_CICIN|nr:hypothetical protein L2E82_12520 [Cichorium intybus]
MVIFSYFFLLFIPYATSVTFNLTSNSQENQFNDLDINKTGDSSFFKGIQVTPDEVDPQRINSTGRATYVKRLHLWENISGELATFTTDFSFVIDSSMKA